MLNEGRQAGKVEKALTDQYSAAVETLPERPEIAPVKLAKEYSDVQIARILQRKRLKTPKGLSFKANYVTNVRRSMVFPKVQLRRFKGKKSTQLRKQNSFWA